MKINVEKFLQKNNTIQINVFFNKFKNLTVEELEEISEYISKSDITFEIEDLLTPNHYLENKFLTNDVSNNYNRFNYLMSEERENAYLAFLKHAKVLEPEEEVLIGSEMHNGKEFIIDLLTKNDFLMDYLLSLETLFYNNNRKTNKLFNLSSDDEQNKISLKEKEKLIKNIFKKINKLNELLKQYYKKDSFVYTYLRYRIKSIIFDLRPTFIFVREIVSFYRNSLADDELINNKIKILEHKIPLFSENKKIEHEEILKQLEEVDFDDLPGLIKDKERLNIYLQIKRLIDSKNNGLAMPEKARLRNEHNIKKALNKIDTGKQIFIIYNLKLVIKIVRNYKNNFLEFFDLIQEGNLGLIKAIDKFEYEKGFKFSTYASWWIKQQIIRTINEKSKTIRVPVHLLDLRKKINQFILKYYNEHGKEASVNTICKEFDITKSKYLTVTEISNPKSLYSQTSNDGESKDTLLDTIVDSEVDTEEQFIHDNLKNDLIKVLEQELADKELYVLKQRFGLNDENSEYTLEEISIPLNISKERVRQIENSALKKLRHPKVGRLLQDFLG